MLKVVGTLPPSLSELRRTSRFAHPTALSADAPQPASQPHGLLPAAAHDIIRIPSHPCPLDS
ncbi:hypothetical protein CT676_30950 [Bradyrhizobium sp. MOS001]|nr:hypothetical protein CT676_30950 [Bradyrhizobium sp. MOS001]